MKAEKEHPTHKKIFLTMRTALNSLTYVYTLITAPRLSLYNISSEIGINSLPDLANTVLSITRMSQTSKITSLLIPVSHERYVLGCDVRTIFGK